MFATNATSKVIKTIPLAVGLVLLTLILLPQTRFAEARCEGKISGYTLIDLDKNNSHSESDYPIAGVSVRLSPEDTTYPDTFATSNMDGYWSAEVCSDIYTVTIELGSVDSDFTMVTANRKRVRLSPNRPGQTHLLFFFEGDPPESTGVLGTNTREESSANTSFILIAVFGVGAFLGVNGYLFRSRVIQDRNNKSVRLA